MDWLARRIWWGMLYLMRRPWMRNLQRKSYGWLSEPKREKARLNLLRQNKFALKWGFKLIRLMVILLTLWVIGLFAFTWAIDWLTRLQTIR